MPSYKKGENGCVGKSDSYWWDPDELILVTDPGTAGYDPRAVLPPDEAMVRSIMRDGVKMPISIRPGAPIVVDGRRRTVASREANRRLREAGQAAVRVRCVVESGNDGEAERSAVICNEMRLDDGPAIKAEKAARLRSHGYDVAEIADTFGVTQQTVKAWLELADAPEKIKKAVREGRMSKATARKVAQEPAEVQQKAAEAASKKEARKAAKKDKPPASRPLGLKKIQAIIDAGDEAEEMAERMAADKETSWTDAVKEAYHAGLRRAAGIEER